VDAEIAVVDGEIGHVDAEIGSVESVTVAPPWGQRITLETVT